MSESNQIYRCTLCGQMTSVVLPGGGALACCGNPMQRLQENSVDAAKEKHVPVLTKVDGGWKVSVGSAAHPMEDKHHIQWIELRVGDIVQRRLLKPGEPPEAVFKTDDGPAAAREYCNLHGLWQS